MKTGCETPWSRARYAADGSGVWPDPGAADELNEGVQASEAAGCEAA